MEALSNWLANNSQVIWGLMIANLGTIILAIVGYVFKSVLDSINRKKANAQAEAREIEFYDKLEALVKDYNTKNQELLEMANKARVEKTNKFIEEIKALNNSSKELTTIQDDEVANGSSVLNAINSLE